MPVVGALQVHTVCCVTNTQQSLGTARLTHLEQHEQRDLGFLLVWLCYNNLITPSPALDVSKSNCNEGMKSNNVDDMVETHLLAWLVQLARLAHR